MPPSSLIFVVILAVWAAYLIQHWVKRRDHIATARSVDRFSEAMRVLERRQRMPRADLSRPVPRSYAVSPARPAAPEVVVKRAESVSTPASVGVASRRRRPAGATAARRPAGVAPRAGVRGRGLVLLTGAAVLVLTVTLAVTGTTPWWVVAGGVGVFAGAVALVRRSVGSGARGSGRGAAGRTTARAARRPLPRPARPSAGAVPAPVEVTATVLTPGDQGAPAGGAAAAVAAGDPRRRATAAVYDIDVVESRRRPAGTRQPLVTFDAPGTWRPVPVPPPTYTLKARAAGPVPESRRPDVTVESTPEYAVPAEPARAPATRELAFDGRSMSFDEEFEDLPAVHSL